MASTHLQLPSQPPCSFLVDQRSGVPGQRLLTVSLLMVLLAVIACSNAARCFANDAPPTAAPQSETARRDTFASRVRPLLAAYCLDCHSNATQEGELNLERFASVAAIRQDLAPWQAVVVQLEAGEMPPRDAPQPSEAERKQLLDWTRSLLDDEARARAGDPGHVPLRRLSNAEFNCLVRDLTGIDLQPAREFPRDGAAGEGFTNAAEALAMSPAMMTKYLDAAKEIAAHAVLLPDGFRFSPAQTRRDWTDESLAKLRAFYGQFTQDADGGLPLKRYLQALWRQRAQLAAGNLTLDSVADNEKLSRKYLAQLWQTLTDRDAPRSFALQPIRTRWRHATDESALDALVADVEAAQRLLWSSAIIGSYRDGNTVRRVAKDPPVVEQQTLRLNLDQAGLKGVRRLPGHAEVILQLQIYDLLRTGEKVTAEWSRPRFERQGQPTMLLRDYAQFGLQYEADYTPLFSQTAKYLTASLEAANTPDTPVATLARRHDLNSAWLQRWIALTALDPRDHQDDEALKGRVVPIAPLQMLDAKTPTNDLRPAIRGWQPRGGELPLLVTNASDKVEHIPGRAGPHQVMVHPLPEEFVAVTWTSPITGRVRVEAKITHAHPSCGNGITWWLEKQTGQQALIFAAGAVDLGGTATATPTEGKVKQGDTILLGVDARDRNHVCDLTEITFCVKELDGQQRVWNLATDIADSVHAGNPHQDRFGNPAVWRAVRGPASARIAATGSPLADNSTLAQWRAAAQNPQTHQRAAVLANQMQALLTGPRPDDSEHPDRSLYDQLVSLDGPLLKDFPFPGTASGKDVMPKFGLKRERFGRRPATTGGESAKAGDSTDAPPPTDDASILAPVDQVLELRLPAALLRDREFVVDCKLTGRADRLAVQFQVRGAEAGATSEQGWTRQAPILAVPDGPGHRRVLEEVAEFRRLLPPLICYPHVIPVDEVVCLKTFHREDEPLLRLFLDDNQAREIDRLWDEHRFITKFPVVENEFLPLFIGFVTQDQPQELVDYFESQRLPFQQRAEAFNREFEEAAPRQLAQLRVFASRAFRRPLTPEEQRELGTLYRTLRSKGVTHEEAFRNVITRILISPSCLLHLEKSPAGVDAQPVDVWELASRLSFFLWSSAPDEALRRAAETGALHEPAGLAAQARRMLQNDKVRALAIEFGTQWIHVRDFDQFREKNERLFPEFDERLRTAMNEEAILFFQNLFQSNGEAIEIINADHAYLNSQLAQHYGVPGITGDHWRRVDGVKQYGRGGILGMASVLAKQSGASRTSPVLRGNWVVETLLGEKLPRPPPNIPQLPEEETGNAGLTMRQLVELHVRAPECASCHQRIDPFGFAFEGYDPIGRRRDKDLGGLAVDVNVRLRDGTEFTGVDGMRDYLLTTKRDVFVRLFCQRLLGYALGRSITLSDQPLLDKMLAMTHEGGRLADLVVAIVASPQFRMIRGRDFAGGR